MFYTAFKHGCRVAGLSLLGRATMSLSHGKKEKAPRRVKDHLSSDLAYIEETWWHSNNMKHDACRPQRVSDR
jgi:hypothetical protein